MCGDCVKKLSEEVKTSTTTTIQGYVVTETVGVVSTDAEPTAELAVFWVQSAAKKRGAGGVVDLRIDAVTPAKGGFAYIARGTAVKIQPEARGA